jgi:hypothetical protein
MLGVLEKAEFQQERKGGKKHKLPLAYRLLMVLEYWREYRTLFHISESYGVSESTCCRTVHWVEDTLIKSGAFSLPGKKALSESELSFEVVMIDATETPIERPKKNRSVSTREKRSVTH